jgi:repressor LexA
VKEMKKEFIQFVEQKMYDAHMNKTELARRANISVSEVQKILSGERKQPSHETFKKLSMALGVNTETLLDKAGFYTVSSKAEPPGNIKDSVELVPVYGVIRADEPMFAAESITKYEPVLKQTLDSGTYFALDVIGDSMVNAGIPDGSVVLVREQSMVNNGEIAAVLAGDENATVKRVYLKDEYVLLKPEHNEHQPQFVKTKDVRILGKVVRVLVDPHRRN